MSHRHFCDFAGHNWQCSGDCECCCGLPMEGHDHSECPVELRACPEHADEQQRSIAVAMSSDPDPAFVQRLQERPHCDCGCAEAEFSNLVGWCLRCDHEYASYTPQIEDLHFANFCPGAPEELKESARKRLNFYDYITCAHACGDEVSDEMLLMLDELCSRSNIKPDNLIEEIARRDGLVKVRLDSGETILCFPDQLQPCDE